MAKQSAWGTQWPETDQRKLITNRALAEHPRAVESLLSFVPLVTIVAMRAPSLPTGPFALLCCCLFGGMLGVGLSVIAPALHAQGPRAHVTLSALNLSDVVASPPFAETLDRTLDSLTASHAPGTLAVYASWPKQRWRYERSAEQPRYLASGIKLFFLAHILEEIDAGRLSLSEHLAYHWVDVRDGAPAMNRHKVGSKVSIDDLLVYMIRDSDNAATDLLLKRVGMKGMKAALTRLNVDVAGPLVNMMDVRRDVYRRLDARADRLKAWQVRDVRWRDGFHPRLDLLEKHIGGVPLSLDQNDLDTAYDAYYATGRNHVSMRQAGTFLERLNRLEIVNAKVSAQMRHRLSHVWSSGHRIDGALPPGSHIAHKTGTQHKRIVDLAIINLPNSPPLILTLSVQGIADVVEAEDILRGAARSIVDATLKSAPPPTLALR